MPKATRSTTVPQRTLSDVVSISRQFLRSVRIDTDLGREDALSGYICQGTARSLLENMSKQIVETNQRAFTWTGPYGGGKSSLALGLCSLVSPNPKIRAKARQVLGLSEGSLVQRAFATKSDGWLVVPVVGKRADVRTELSNALAEARGVSPSRRKNADVVAELVDEAERHPNGVLVIIDELGKLLEATAMEGGDIGFFQELAENASRCSRKLVVVGILHQAFDAYQPLVAFELSRLSTRLGSSTILRQRKRWRKNDFTQHRVIQAYTHGRMGHLPQGAPTSPMLANLAMVAFDEQLCALAARHGLTNTRYADDIALSTRRQDFNRDMAAKLIGQVYALMGKHGLSPNSTKTRVVPPGGRKVLLGLLVDDEVPRLTRAFKSALRMHLYFIRHPEVGPAAHAARRGFAAVAGLRNHIEGLLSFARQIEPEYAKARNEELAAVHWPA